MEIKFSNEITINGSTPEILAWCKKELVIDNPEYAKKERMGLWVGKTPRTLSLYKTNGEALILPVGAFRHIKGILDRGNDVCFFKTDLADNNNVYYGADINLFDYQQEALQAMINAKYGILQSPAGSGKTQIGIALAVALGKKCLWLTHTQDLLKQSYDRAKQYIDESLLGTITAGKVNIGAGITFATVQTLCKQDLTQYKYEWDVVIVDECHRVAGTPTAMTQFSKVISNLASPHKYGLSATVHRADGMIKCCYMLLGDVRHIVSDEAVKSRCMQVKVEKVHTKTQIPYKALDTDGTINYTKFITELAHDARRNNIILERIIAEPEHYHLILSDRLSQLAHLWNCLPNELQEQASIIHGKMTSKKGKAEREQAIEDMRAGRKHILFASYKLAKEGLDIPRLDRLHLATPQKDYAVIVQSVGRIARVFEGKTQPICFDYIDDFKMAENMYRKRCTHYKKAGVQYERI